MGKLFVLGGFTFVYFIFIIPLSVVVFIFGMLHRPIKTYNETRKRKYRMMAEQALTGQPAFEIKPLNDEQKQIIRKKLHSQKIVLLCLLISLWSFNILFHVSIFALNQVPFYCCILILILQIVFTVVLIRCQKKKYEKAEGTIEQLGLLQAAVIGYYHILYKWNRRLFWHFIISAYVDENQKVCCYHKCNGYHHGKIVAKGINDMPAYQSQFAGYRLSDGTIDVLMYKDQFAGYCINEHPKMF